MSWEAIWAPIFGSHSRKATFSYWYQLSAYWMEVLRAQAELSSHPLVFHSFTLGLENTMAVVCFVFPVVAEWGPQGPWTLIVFSEGKL